MELKEKLEALKRIPNEAKFREVILMTLFDKMGLSPNHTHGPEEKGKDIVCKEENSLKMVEHIAVVAKVGKITGSTSGVAGFQTVFNQIQEAFNYPYKDPKTKVEIPINKVVVVTNEDIPATTQNKIVDRLKTINVMNANVHFVDGEKMVSLIDEHWPDFWAASENLLADEEDYMTNDTGLVLYVIALAHTLSRSGKKKKVEREMSFKEIQSQTKLPKAKIEASISNYLLKYEYVEKRAKAKNDRFRLHSRKCVDYLLTDPNQIRLLFAIREIANSNRHFTLSDALKTSKKDVFSFAPPFVKKTLTEFLKGNYIRKDESRGSGHYNVIDNTIDEELPYLQAQLKYLGRFPSRAE